MLDVDPAKRKSWCPEKDRFLIIDCWGNFDYFGLHPKGREPGDQVPIAVRLFRARLDKLEVALGRGAADVVATTVADLRADLAALPANNVVVLERQPELARVRVDAFWTQLRESELSYLRQTITPVLRARAELEFKAARFETDVVDYGTAFLASNDQAERTLRDSIVEQVSELPLGVNLVAQQRDLIESVVRGQFWESVTDAALRELVAKLAPLMKFRQSRAGSMISLNLADITTVRERITVGPDGRDLPIAAYRQRVEEAVRALLAENPVLQRIQGGEAVGESDLRALADLLARQDLPIDEERLRRAYDVRRAGFLQLMRHVLGIEQLESWPTLVSREFDQFITDHSNYSALQLRFLQTLRTFVLQRGSIARADLIDPPFTQLHPQGVRGVFTPAQVEEILGFTERLAA